MERLLNLTVYYCTLTWTFNLFGSYKHPHVLFWAIELSTVEFKHSMCIALKAEPQLQWKFPPGLSCLRFSKSKVCFFSSSRRVWKPEWSWRAESKVSLYMKLVAVTYKVKGSEISKPWTMQTFQFDQTSRQRF